MSGAYVDSFSSLGYICTLLRIDTSDLRTYTHLCSSCSTGEQCCQNVLNRPMLFHTRRSYIDCVSLGSLQLLLLHCVSWLCLDARFCLMASCRKALSVTSVLSGYGHVSLILRLPFSRPDEVYAESSRSFLWCRQDAL